MERHSFPFSSFYLGSYWQWGSLTQTKLNNSVGNASRQCSHSQIINLRKNERSQNLWAGLYPVISFGRNPLFMFKSDMYAICMDRVGMKTASASLLEGWGINPKYLRVIFVSVIATKLTGVWVAFFRFGELMITGFKDADILSNILWMDKLYVKICNEMHFAVFDTNR